MRNYRPTFRLLLWLLVALYLSLGAATGDTASLASRDLQLVFTLPPRTTSETPAPSATADNVAELNVYINEISSRGTSDVCDEEDWIELFNGGDRDVDLAGYVLFDNKGISDPDAFVFPTDTMIQAKSYLLLCTKSDSEGALSPQFGIGGDDTLTLARRSADGGTSREWYIIIDIVDLPNANGDAFDVTYARNPATGVFEYTSTSTPESANIMTELRSEEELVAKHKAALVAQDEKGRRFFNMDNEGRRVEGALPAVMELKLYMNETDYIKMTEYGWHKQYFEFDRAELWDSISNPSEKQQVWSREAPGRIRTKGQYTLFQAKCKDTLTMPFQIDLTPGGDQEQYLFGVQELYLRTHMGDTSYMRDWAYHRMLARFGLPHLRSRKVNFYINNKHMGFYTLMEAQEQEYVFARAFPDYNPNDFSLFKFKNFADDCGRYKNETINAAEELLKNQRNNDPDSKQILNRQCFFERNDDAPLPPVRNRGAWSECVKDFLSTKERTFVDVAAAWLHYDKDCGEMLVETEIVDERLGDGYKSEVKDLINENFRFDINRCDENCVESTLLDNVNAEQWSKMAAFYSATLISDTPRDNFNNFYLGITGDGEGWNMVPYDFNFMGSAACFQDTCNERFIHWSVAQPTCESLESNQLFGPVLTNPEYFDKYMSYTRDFVENVMTDEDIIDQMVEHANAIQSWVRTDFYSFGGIYYDEELSPDSARWIEDTWRFPLLPFLKARAKDLRAQFKAIDNGKFPRGPHVGVGGDYELLEVCPDWRSEGADRSSCHDDCFSEDCHMDNYTVPSFCHEERGICMRGIEDPECEDIPDWQQHLGLKPESSFGTPQYCYRAGGIPLAITECPVHEHSEEKGYLITIGAIAVTLVLLFMGYKFGSCKGQAHIKDQRRTQVPNGGDQTNSSSSSSSDEPHAPKKISATAGSCEGQAQIKDQRRTQVPRTKKPTSKTTHQRLHGGYDVCMEEEGKMRRTLLEKISYSRQLPRPSPRQTSKADTSAKEDANAKHTPKTTWDV